MLTNLNELTELHIIRERMELTFLFPYLYKSRGYENTSYVPLLCFYVLHVFFMKRKNF